MMPGELEVLVLAAAASVMLAVMWSLAVPVSDPAFSHDWEAEAAEYASRIRPGDHWGR